MPERLSPLQFNNVGLLDRWIRIMRDGGTIDENGGLVPGPAVVVATVLASVEPTLLSRLVKESLSGGAVANTENYHVTFWYVPGISVSNFIEFDDVDYPPPANGSPPPVTLRTLEILELRQVKMAHRYLEILAKERVS